MAKFVYRMQSILNIKCKLEEQEKMGFATAQARLMKEEEKLYGYQTKCNFYLEEQKRSREKRIVVSELRWLGDASETMNYYIKEQRGVVSVEKRKTEQARERLTEAMKERKIHEKLRENAFHDFCVEEENKERVMIDELVSFKYGRNQIEETSTGGSNG